MLVLGVNVEHDASVALVRDGLFVEVINEERLSRFKNHQGFPGRAVAYIKQKYQIECFDHVVLISASGRYSTALFSDKENVLLRKRTAEPIFLKAILFQCGVLQIWRAIKYQIHIIFKKPFIRRRIDKIINQHFPTEKISHLDHHLAHAWSALAFCEQPSEALLVTLDGEGDGLCGSINIYNNNRLRREVAIPSGVGIGTLYGKITEYLGMRRNEHEYKVMGLAPYAKSAAGDAFLEQLRLLISFSVKSLSFSTPFHMQYAKYYFVVKNFSNFRFEAIASGIQKFTEELVLQLLRAALVRYPLAHLCVSGGVFMNIKLNQIIQSQFTNLRLTFTPSCGDDSLAIGAAKFGYDSLTTTCTKPITSLYLGSAYSNNEVEAALNKLPRKEVRITRFDTSDNAIEEEVARLLAEGNIVARFSGRMEWGSRALGNRSILANPFDIKVIKVINEAVKNRDFWMPFAPTILTEMADQYLINCKPSPFMMIGFDTTQLAHEQIPAALHPYDYSCRPQILEQSINPEYYHLINCFKEYTGIGAVLNTSFNLHGSPIVESPEDAVHTFLESGLAHLAINNYLLVKITAS